jgi:hypothetical protein
MSEQVWTNEQLAIAERWAPYVEALGKDPAVLTPFEIYMLAGEIIGNPVVLACAQELAGDATVVSREHMLAATREVYSAR